MKISRPAAISSSNRRSFNRIVRRLACGRPFRPRRRGVVLVEVINNSPHQIAIAHVVSAITRTTSSRVWAYVDPAHTGLNRRQALQQRLRYLLRSWSSKNSESTFAAMGAKRLVYPHFSESQIARALSFVYGFTRIGPSKHDVEQLRVDGVLVGDLIYDDYLLKLQCGTVEPDSPAFVEHLVESLKVFFYWQDFFSNQHVVAVIGNSVYRQALVARIAISHGCDVFDAQLPRVVRLVGDGYQFEDTRHYRSEFSSLGTKQQRLAVADRALAEKRRGKPDLSNSHLATPSGIRSEARLLSSSPTPKILITPHCFSDSAHAFGPMLFPDFQEWLAFLASIAKNSPYEWYLKPHPRGGEDLPTIRQIFSGCHNFKILPDNASLDQLGDEGVSVALTMRGHIGFDFPLMGIPVISCTPGYRYRNYTFNIQVDTVSEYERLLTNIESLPRTIDQNEMTEFYYMDSILNHPNIFFPDLLAAQGRAREMGPDGILDVFAQVVDEKFMADTVDQLADFVSAKQLRFRRLADPEGDPVLH